MYRIKSKGGGERNNTLEKKEQKSGNKEANLQKKGIKAYKKKQYSKRKEQIFEKRANPR